MCAIRLVLADEIDRKPDASCRVVFMDYKRKPRERNVLDNAIELQQGRSSSNEPDRYPGDRNVPVNACERITVQIHMVRSVVKVRGSDGREYVAEVLAEQVPALAVHLTPTLAERLQDVIAQPVN
jgi:hypothetical protein